MSELEAELRKAIAAGNMHGITLFPSPQGWQGNVRWKNSTGWTVEIDADPIQALLKALRSTTRYDPKALAGTKPTAAAPAAESVLKGGLFD